MVLPEQRERWSVFGVVVQTEYQIPVILESKVVARSKLFQIDARGVRFANGTERRLERIRSRMGSTVLVVPMLDRETLLLIREYCAGTHTYELAFPTGTVNEGEAIEEAANRELKEEVGFGAEQISRIMRLKVLPGHFDHETHLVLAEKLFPEKLLGDEPEDLAVVRWSVADTETLLQAEEFKEARSIAALLLVERLLRSQMIHENQEGLTRTAGLESE